MTYDELLQKFKMREEYIANQDDTISNLVAEIERLKCVIELTINLKQQAEMEIERLEQDLQQHIKWNEEHTKARAELTVEVELLKQYIQEFGWCGYYGSLYSNAKLKVNCTICYDKHDCERYQILNKANI